MVEQVGMVSCRPLKICTKSGDACVFNTTYTTGTRAGRRLGARPRRQVAAARVVAVRRRVPLLPAS